MGTMIAHPQLPDSVRERQGQAAQARLEILDRKMTELQIRGDIRPATIINMSPFVLDLGSGLIPYKVPRCPDNKKFHAETVTTCRSYPIYRGNEQMSDRSIRNKWDVNILTPIMQAMEFKHYYVGESEEDQGIRQGGVVVIDGAFEGLTPSSEVMSPSFMFRKNNRYIILEKFALGDLLKEQEKMMRLKCQAVLDQANVWNDDEDTRKNIQYAERTWHDFALSRQWITAPLAWRTNYAGTAERCPRCTQPYTSKTGVCKCSYVYDPFKAFMQGEILIDHVRMNVLNKEQWVKVKEEQAKREAARA